MRRSLIVAERHDRGGQKVGGYCNRRAVKVSARDDVAGVGEDHRVVGRAVGFDRHRVADEAQRVAHGAVHLGGAAHRVRILHLAAVLM
jgi:hypothetical protein